MGQEPGLRIAKWTVARAYRSLGRYDEALNAQLAIKDEYYPGFDVMAGDSDLTAIDGYVVEEIGECLWALNRQEEARPYLSIAHEILNLDQWLVKNESERLESFLRKRANKVR